MQESAIIEAARARRRNGDARAALAMLSGLPAGAVADSETALAYAASGDSPAAFAAMERATRTNPALLNAWRTLADEFLRCGDAVSADEAFVRHVGAAAKDKRLMQAAAALAANDVPLAERSLKGYLKRAPTDVAAIRMLAEVAARLGRFGDSLTLLERCLELAPGFAAARYNYASVLLRQNRAAQALGEIEKLVAEDSENPGYQSLKSAILARLGDFDAALDGYERVLAHAPGHARIRMSYGHALKTVGRQADAISAYEQSIKAAPSLGEAWWSLANLKTFRFRTEQVDAMRSELGRADLARDDCYHLHFALGKALEDVGEYARSFEHYREGNRLRRMEVRYDPDENHAAMKRTKAVFTAELIKSRSGQGSPAPDPIFIVGLPRAGSTLIEQILSSHSQVEGTMELPDIIAIARDLGFRKGKGDKAVYPQSVAALSAAQLTALGEEYLRRTRIQRRGAKPFFIDKMPNNFAHAGLIMLILPNAKIIDARRHPLACCFSNFKQHFARGQSFTYGLEDVGRFYCDYVELMAHFDAAAPGRIHRVFHERLVERPEAETRRLLDYCRLPFEDQCLRFYETERPVRTASSEQVRRPIFTEGLDQWRNYDTWLAPLRSALGNVLDKYPETTSF
jgi:tetratricopeptide (TPR) repeat protein